MYLAKLVILETRTDGTGAIATTESTKDSGKGKREDSNSGEEQWNADWGYRARGFCLSAGTHSDGGLSHLRHYSVRHWQCWYVRIILKCLPAFYLLIEEFIPFLFLSNFFCIQKWTRFPRAISFIVIFRDASNSVKIPGHITRRMLIGKMIVAKQVSPTLSLFFKRK